MKEKSGYSWQRDSTVFFSVVVSMWRGTCCESEEDVVSVVSVEVLLVVNVDGDMATTKHFLVWLVKL